MEKFEAKEFKLYNNCPEKLEFEEICLVEGNTVQSRFFGRDIIAGIRKIFGLELIEYTQLLTKAREVAKERMVKQAIKLGANAIINVRYQTSEITTNASEILIYGTAIKVIK